MIETQQVIKDAVVEFYAFRWLAQSRRDQAMEERDWVTVRYEVERVSKEARRELGWWSRWTVVPYQNLLRRSEEVEGGSDHS
jgi:hypothetical protein